MEPAFVLLVHFLLNVVLAQNLLAIDPLPHKKCHLEDSFCLKYQAKAVLKAYMAGIPELKLQAIDKMHFKYVEVKKNKLHYQMFDADVGGFNSTVIDAISINTEYKIMRIAFHTNLDLNFDYKADGEVYGFPVIGEGRAHMILKNLHVNIVITFDIKKNEQGKEVMHLKEYFYGADAIDGVHHEFANLFKGVKEKSDIALPFLNKTWRTLVASYDRFFTDEVIKEIFETLKIYLRSWPLEDLAIYP